MVKNLQFIIIFFVFFATQSSWSIILEKLDFVGKVYSVNKDRVVLITRNNYKISVPINKVDGGMKAIKYGKWVKYRLFQDELSLIKPYTKQKTEDKENNLPNFNEG